MIESTYLNNGKEPVILIAHSMGSPMTLYFLNRKTQAWKDKYVKAYITMAGVWGGTVRAMKVFALGKWPSNILGSAGVMCTAEFPYFFSWQVSKLLRG